MVETLFVTLLKIILYLALIPALLGTILVVINRDTKKNVVIYFGYRAQIVGGCIGIIIHETSHLLMALLFRHHIKSFRLLRFPNQNSEDQSLGYVNHTWNQKSFYQRTGNLFIGIAPIIGNTLVILALSKVLVPTILTSVQNFVADHFISLNLATSSTTNSFVTWQFIVWLLLLINICIGGFDLSPADMNNSAMGLISFTILVVVISVIVALTGFSTGFVAGLQSFFLPIDLAMLFALLISGLINLIIRGAGKVWR